MPSVGNNDERPITKPELTFHPIKYKKIKIPNKAAYLITITDTAKATDFF